MSKTSVLQIRLDRSTKEDAERLFAAMGMSFSEAVRIFLTQCVADQKMPFTPTSLGKKGTGKAFGALNVFASAGKRGRERDTWVASLSAKPVDRPSES